MTATVHPRVGRAAGRGWWADGLEAGMWLACATGVALMVSSGGAQIASAADAATTLGRALGIVAAVLMMTQVLLASRAPWVERALGHDSAIALHTRIGPLAILLLLSHVALLTVATAHFDGRSIVEQFFAWPQYGWFMVAAQVAAAAFVVVLLTSLARVRRRWRYERWYAVHALVYVGVALAVPHQFLEGSTFRTGGVSWWFWALLWVVAIGSFVAFRIGRPLVHTLRHRPRVESVTTHDDGTTSVVVSGRDLDQVRAQPGQFFVWRFLEGPLRWQQHPYSLSAAPGGRLRLTARPVGEGSARLAQLSVGTRVILDGPLGVFTHAARTTDRVILIAAGIGITPVLAMLQRPPAGVDLTVVMRASAREDAPLLAEVEEACARTGARLEVSLGPRGDGWTARENRIAIADLVGDEPADVYICGPRSWALLVEHEAREAGIAPEAIHREEFGW